MIPPSNFANAIAPFVPLGRQAVSEEDPDHKRRASTLKPMEESAESARQENRRSPDERTHEAEERARLSQAGYEGQSDETGQEAGENEADDAVPQKVAEDGEAPRLGPEERRILIEQADRSRELQRRLTDMGVSVESPPLGRLFNKNI